MFNDYIRKILPIPIIDIKVGKNNNYLYKIVTYSHVADECNDIVKQRVNKCKKIKSIDGWYFDENINNKYAVIEFNKMTNTH